MPHRHRATLSAAQQVREAAGRLRERVCRTIQRAEALCVRTAELVQESFRIDSEVLAQRRQRRA
jgi:hypothetical protein